MNVGLTRAKYALFVLGREEALQSNVKWASLIQHARERGAIVDVPNAAFDVLAKPPVAIQADTAGDQRKRRATSPPTAPAPTRQHEAGAIVERTDRTHSGMGKKE